MTHDGSIINPYEVAERVQLQARIAALENQLAERNQAFTTFAARVRIFMDHTPVSIAMFDREMNYMFVSRQWREEYQMGDKDIIGRSHYDIFPNMPQHWRDIHQRCLAGAIEENSEDPYTAADGSQEWLAWQVCPWYTPEKHVGGLVIFSQAVTRRKRAELALAQSEKQLQATVQQQQLLIETIQNLSTPVIPVADNVLVLPLVGVVTTQRIEQVLDTLLQAVAKNRADFVILDITGVPLVDTDVANGLVRAAQAVQLLGGQVILTGIRPEVAQTLVGLHIDLRGLYTFSTLQSGIGFALGQR